MNNKFKSLVNWYYIEDWSNYPGPKGRVVPDAKGYDNPRDYNGTELYIPQGAIGYKKGNSFIDEEGNDVPFDIQYFKKSTQINESNMSKENLRMQMLAGIITESQYKTKLKKFTILENRFNSAVSRLMLNENEGEVFDNNSSLNEDELPNDIIWDWNKARITSETDDRFVYKVWGRSKTYNYYGEFYLVKLNPEDEVPDITDKNIRAKYGEFLYIAEYTKDTDKLVNEYNPQ